jgi:redox-sensing transcriptional repressor
MGKQPCLNRELGVPGLYPGRQGASSRGKLRAGTTLIGNTLVSAPGERHRPGSSEGSLTTLARAPSGLPPSAGLANAPTFRTPAAVIPASSITMREKNLEGVLTPSSFLLQFPHTQTVMEFSNTPCDGGLGRRSRLEPLRRVVLERLIRYYRYLSELTARKSPETITSAQLGAALDIDPTQVRKDFGAIGLMGISRVGYEVCEVCRAIRLVFGFDRPYSAVLVGAGHLGSALLNYPGFARFGLRIVAAFDNDPAKIGQDITGVEVRSTRAMKAYVERHGIRLAILTTPVSASQGLTDRLVEAGVKAIWNFSPTRLTVPAEVLVKNEHISLGLAQLAYHLNTPPEGGHGKLPVLEKPCQDPCPPPGS